MSGAPIYRRGPDGSLRAVAMNVGDKTESRRVMTVCGRNVANTAVAMAGLLADPQLRQMTLDAIAAFGRGSPAFLREPRGADGSQTGGGQ